MEDIARLLPRLGLQHDQKLQASCLSDRYRYGVMTFVVVG